jgi:alpha-glucosidase
MKKTTLLCILLINFSLQLSAKVFKIYSPDQKTLLTVKTTPCLTYSVAQENTMLLKPSKIALHLNNNEIWGIAPQVKTKKTWTTQEKIKTHFYSDETLVNTYCGLLLKCKKDWGIEFRVYNEGVAYRFLSYQSHSYTIQNETVEYQLTDCVQVTLPYVRTEGTIEQQLGDSFENTYTTTTPTKIDQNRLIMVPMVIHTQQGKRLCITESDLRNYPGLYLKGNLGKNNLQGYFARYPKKEIVGGHNRLQKLVQSRENYIAKVNQKRTFPWRILMIANNDIALANNHLTYCLANPSQLKDTNWIKPGKVAWDWWNDWNLEGVDFKTGVNNATYQYYIDFAAKYGIEYVILDEGWAVNLQHDLFQVVPEINLKTLIQYAQQRNVGLVLWAGYYAFDKDMEKVCQHYAQMGIKGFKIDFMNRNDQKMVAFHERAAKMCAKYHLIADFHGTYIPAGLNRTYPNALNFEAVHGLEQCKWIPKEIDQVTYDVTLPYTRMLAGPIDYTQGAMRNANQENYTSIWSEPMSQGTRCHQLGAYIVFLSPFNMLCDAPTNYEKNSSNTRFIAEIPTTWDESKVIAGEMGKYVVTARRKGNDWYIGGLNNWEERDIHLDLAQIVGNKTAFSVTLFKDGINANRKATDYQHSEYKTLDLKQLSTLHMAKGGGFALKIRLK